MVHVDISELQSIQRELKPAIRARHFLSSFFSFSSFLLHTAIGPRPGMFPYAEAPRVPEVISFTESCAMGEIF